jgi:hypothetical protein
MTEVLESFENEDADQSGAPSGTNGGYTLCAAENNQHDSQAVPDPTVAHAGRSNHPDADPTRGAPAVHAAHEPVIAVFD